MALPWSALLELLARQPSRDAWAAVATASAKSSAWGWALEALKAPRCQLRGFTLEVLGADAPPAAVQATRKAAGAAFQWPLGCMCAGVPMGVRLSWPLQGHFT